MNVEMWENPATQRNVAQLRADGIALLGPAQGAQACGETGYGRMLEPDDLLEDIIAFFQPKVLAGKRMLLTAGPTFEAIDPVRGITNLSSGKTGFALARAARDAGAEVTLVAGPASLATPRGVKRVDVDERKRDARRGHARSAGRCFRRRRGRRRLAGRQSERPQDQEERRGELRRRCSSNPTSTSWPPSPRLPQPPFCVGFAAESEDVVDNAKRKLASKNVQLVVGNRAQDTFGADGSELFLVDAAGVTTLAHADKLAQARRLVAEIAERLARR